MERAEEQTTVTAEVSERCGGFECPDVSLDGFVVDDESAMACSATFFNGFVPKSEYVIYKLKEMGKVSENDILLICGKFDELDTGNYGKITLADLMEPPHR
ncbi:hypothetical protein Ancab_021236 [Ancistrocladus abbreviatus]